MSDRSDFVTSAGRTGTTLMPARDLLLTQLQETGEITWPMGWPLSWLVDLVETLGIDHARVMLIGTTIRVARS